MREEKKMTCEPGSLARSVHSRMGKFVAPIAPLLRSAIEGGKADADEDIKENVLQTYEAFVLRCSKDVAPHLNAIVELSLKYLSFDPNFAGDEDDAGSGSESGGFSGSDEEVRKLTIYVYRWLSFFC